MIKSIYRVILFSCFTITSLAHTANDSLFDLLEKNIPDTQRIKINNLLSERLFFKNTDTAFYLVNEAYKLASEQNFGEGLARACDNLSFYHYNSGNFDSALLYADKAIAFCKQFNKKDFIINCYITKADIFGYLKHTDSTEHYYTLASHLAKERGNRDYLALIYNNYANYLDGISETDKALENYLLALEVFRELGSRRNQATILGNIADIYFNKEMYDKANELINEALLLNLEIDNKIGIASNYNGLGLVANKLEKYSEAVEYYRKALEINKSLGIKSKEAMNYYNMAFNYSSMDEYEKALKNYQSSAEICEEIGLEAGLVHNYLGMGELYSKTNEYKKASHYLDLALKLSKKFSMKQQQLGCYERFYRLHKEKGSFKKALESHELFVSLKDSLFTIEKEQIISELQTEFETERKENQIRELKQKEKISRLMQKLGILIIMILILSSVFAIIFSRKRQVVARQKLKIQEKENEKNQVILQANKQELTGKAYSLMKAENYIKQITDELQAVMKKEHGKKQDELKPIMELLRSSNNNKALWKEFENRFNELNDNFITKLVKAYPMLSPTEIKICTMLRMQLSSKEIAEMSNRSPRTVEYTRTNIRKKMDLDSSENLTNHILNI